MRRTVEIDGVTADELAAKVAEIVLAALEPRLRALEEHFRDQAGGEYLRPCEAARRFAISTKELRILSEIGHITRYDAGSHARYRADELEAYLSRNKPRKMGQGQKKRAG